jgi:hypothetical protein
MVPSDERPPHHVRSLVGDVVIEMLERLDESATAVSESIHAACQELSDDLYRATRQSTRANLGLVTTMIAEGADPALFTPPEEALAYARTYVHEGLSFELLTRVYREGEHAYARLWRERLQAAAAAPAQLGDSVGYIEDWLFAYVRAINQQLALAYADEREQWIRGSIAVRSDEVRAILSGARIDMIEASSRLGYRLDSRHVAFVIFSVDPETVDPVRGARAVEELEAIAAQVADGFGASSWLAVPMVGYYAGWVAVGEDTGTRPPLRLRPGLRIAFGRPGAGIAGFRRSYLEALVARRVSELSNETPVSLSFSDVSLEALLTTDVDEARRFVQDELGELFDETEPNRRLLRTLEVYLEEDSSFVRSARRLGVHENTVAYRVRRAEGTLGRPTGERQLELRNALRLAHFLGSRESPL